MSVMSVSYSRGFTLVEFAIVMVLFGLLLGAVLKGQELMNNGRIDATIAQVEALTTATETFSDTFGGLPGDLAKASLRVPNCNVAICEATGGLATSGDGMVGMTNWGATWESQTAAAGAMSPGFPKAETILFWNHLLVADLLSSVSNTVSRSGPGVSPVPEWGQTHPSGVIGGGFIVGWGNEAKPPGMAAAYTEKGPAGLILALVATPVAALTTTTDVQPMTPGRAYQFDSKMDDGRPHTGFVRAYGNALSCYSGAAGNYQQTVTRRNCGLIFRIRG